MLPHLRQSGRRWRVLSGKNNYGLEEDDYRSAACVADYIGGKVGNFVRIKRTSSATLLSLLVPRWCSRPRRRMWLLEEAYVPSALPFRGHLCWDRTLVLQGLIFYKVKDMPDVEKAFKVVLVISMGS